MYIQEAHPVDLWQLSSNVKDGVLFASPQTDDEREDTAETCVVKLAIKMPALVDGVSGSQSETPIPPGDYRHFYMQFRDAVIGIGANPVPPEQTFAVMAVVEVAIRSSVERRALALSLTEAEIRAYTTSSTVPGSK